MLAGGLNKQRGISLVELMVGAVVGLFVVIAASSVYINALSSGNDSGHLIRVNQTVRSMMDVMVFDLYRAGYSASAAAGVTGNSFAQRNVTTDTDIHISSDRTCILYTYDYDKDGVVDANEFFGFRYNSTSQTAEVIDSTSPPTNTASTTNCSALNWKAMNYDSDVVVTGLTFSTEGSRCIAFNPSDSSQSTNWQLTGDNYYAACDTQAVSGNTVPLGAATPSGVTVPAAQTARAEVRQIIITLTARHAKDSTLTRTISETVRVKNDRVS